MKKVRDIFGKKGFGKGSPRFKNCLSARFSAGRGKDGRSRLFSRLKEMFSTAGAGARGVRPGRSGAFFFCHTASKKFGRAVPLQIGGSHPRAPSPRRWAMPSGMSPQSGRSMLEMLGVLAIIGVLSVAALAGLTYAMNKHRANETIYDVMLRGTNVPMIDEYYYNKASGYEFRFPGLVNNGRQGTYYPMTTKKDAGSSYYVEATGVTYRVCEMILKMNPTDIDQIVVGNTVYQGDSDICGTSDGLAMKFCFGEDGTICDGTGQGGSGSGGSSGGSSGSSGSGTDPVDPCEGIIASTDCSISADETDSNGCVTVKKITCGTDTYCSGTTCEPCPVAETCAGESCCTLTGPNDVCGRPTKEVGTLSTVTHSDLNANGCCEETTEESCSLNPVTPRTCTPTCDGTCQSDGSCQKVCEANTYGPDCLPCGSGAVSDGTTATCACDTENGFTGTWTAPATGSDDNGCTQGSTCETNANCKSGYFCAFEDPVGYNSGSGECQLISTYELDSTTVAGFVRSTSAMTWWSAQNWCLAQNKIQATRESIGCSNFAADYCTSDTVNLFIIAWGTTGSRAWLEIQNSDSTFSWMMRLDNGYVGVQARYTSYLALCQ